MTNSSQIWNILKGIGWRCSRPEFDPPYEVEEWDICQLISGTEDGFHEIESKVTSEIGPDPPWDCGVDHPFQENNSDPPFGKIEFE